MTSRFLRIAMSLTLLALAGVGLSNPGFAETTLEAKLVPAIVVNGPLNSLQQIQYSTNLADTNAWTDLAYVRLDVTPKPFYDDSANGGKRFYRTKMVGVADTNLVWIPPGVFLMGSPTNEEGRFASEGPQTLVTLTQGFLIGRFEVTIAEWFDVMGTLPAGNVVTNSRHSVTGMNWGEATNYCDLRTVADIAAGRIPPGWSYRLPTEAEWEYACRAGTTTPFGIGTGTELRNDGVRRDANFNGNLPYPNSITPANPISNDSDRTVGRFAPNAFGLYDMHGNSEEWCLDNASGVFQNLGTLPGGSVTNHIGLVGGLRKVARGGGGNSNGNDCRSASRIAHSDQQDSATGFRVVLIPANEP